MPGTAAKAHLYIATGCAHCATVVEGLIQLVKAGKLASLEIVNLSLCESVGQVPEIRSVPLLQLGPFRLVGTFSPAELAGWVEAAQNSDGWPAYYAHLLEHQRLDEAIARVKTDPAGMTDLLSLVADAKTSMSARIGVGAVIEELSGATQLRGAVPELVQLTLSESQTTRADACHYLGLTGDPAVIPSVRRLLRDEDSEVREIAGETLAMLGAREDLSKIDSSFE